MDVLIETERLILREIQLTDVDGLYKLDSDVDVHKYLGNKLVKNKAQTLKMIENIHKQYQENGIGRWAIIDKATNDFIGWTGLKYEQDFRKNFSYYDLGYRLRRPYWGNGIATEAAIESLKYGFDILNLKEIYAGAHIENIASNKILTKVGFKFVETFDQEGEMHNWYKIEPSK